MEVVGAGLDPGDRVVVEGKFALRDGARVAVQKAGSAQPQP